jgi:putative membrane protein
MSDETKTGSTDIWEYAKLPMDASVRLSFERTMLSNERTLMSWVRTATSLITFGFTLYKFFEFEIGKSDQPRPSQIVGPREFAMIMIGLGLVGLALATVQNWRFRTHMRKSGIKASPSFTTLMAALIAALGLLAFLATVFRW